MSTLSTHILDISTGKPAQGVTVYLQQEGKTLATGVTNAQGRIPAFVPSLPAGRYRLVAEIGAWFRDTGRDTLYPCAQIDFVTGETADEHFHLPFVIAPGGWSTYRGS
ncbi:5-hydroxyisourate hydrolase [Enterobacter genomosp. O]|uniref:hydroxyisourate hydrolase n=1 Tax=Enterobacter genomosp. O TaxID=2364150 RepID=UPI000642FD08|nr:hydroxyisourate hydrolase [Enterobacter genomosp. O]KLP55271.1 5-hydroxyisourate hydrolase [Enterobacter genomosp. O]